MIHLTGDLSISFWQLGMIDRGADLEEISQYPHEKEILMPPLTGVQVLDNGKRVDGKRLVVDVRLTSNLLSQTIEQARCFDWYPYEAHGWLRSMCRFWVR